MAKHEEAYVMTRARIAYVDILGITWMPASLASLRIDLSDYDLDNIGEFTRKNVQEWVTKNAGDFQAVIDFRAICGAKEIPWDLEENEFLYLDTLSPEED